MKDKELTNAEREIQKRLKEHFQKWAEKARKDDFSGPLKDFSFIVDEERYAKLLEDTGAKTHSEANQIVTKFLYTMYQGEDVRVKIGDKVGVIKPDAVHSDTSTQGTEPTAPVVLPPQPPLDAEFILHLLLNKDEQDALIGDLIERYGKKCERLGVRRANFWFYAEVCRTAWPLIKRFIAKAGGLIAVGEWLRRHIS